MFKVSPASLQTFIKTRLKLTPPVIIIMVSGCNCLKLFCVFCTVIRRCTDTFYHPVQLITKLVSITNERRTFYKNINFLQHLMVLRINSNTANLLASAAK
jgi:hypothetical protein